MRYVPTYCDKCSRAGLNEQHRAASCAQCGNVVRVVPGLTYAAGDLALYEELRDALREAGVGPLNAARLIVQVGRASTSSPGLLFRRVSKSLPSLAVVEMGLRTEEALRKADGMLTTLLEAIAGGRRQSGTYPAMAAPAVAAPGAALPAASPDGAKQR